MIPGFVISFLLLLTFPDPPAGTIKVKDYYIDKTEILNIHWVEYLRIRSKDLDSLEIKALYPQQPGKGFAQPENQFKPLVLITYEQAMEYCRWRSEVVSKKLKKKITYRLPSPEEWKEIAQEILVSTETEKELKAIHKLMVKNDGAYLLLEQNTSKEKLSHLFDNVSEMTLSKGVAMGPSNYDMYKLEPGNPKYLETCLKTSKYSSPHPYLGFRCIAVMEE